MSEKKRKNSRSAQSVLIVILSVIVLAVLVGWLVYKNSPEVRDWAADAGLVGTADLSGTEWSWQRSEFVNGSRIEGPGGEAFAVSFQKDGHFTSTTDCNSLFGTYATFSSRLTISPLASTKMWCGSDSLETEYARQLERAESYSVVVNELRINLADESGQMVFIKK